MGLWLSLVLLRGIGLLDGGNDHILMYIHVNGNGTIDS